MRAYLRNGEWWCMAEPVAARFQDLPDAQPVEQRLHAVLENSYANVIQSQTQLTEQQRSDPECMGRRTRLTVLLPA